MSWDGGDRRTVGKLGHAGMQYGIAEVARIAIAIDRAGRDAHIQRWIAQVGAAFGIRVARVVDPESA